MGVSEWDLSSIIINSVQNLTLSWDPPNSNLQIDLTHQQWAALSNIYIVPANTNQNLSICVDGNAQLNTLGKIHSIGNDSPHAYILNPYFDPNINVIIGTVGNQTLTAPI